MRLEEAIDFFSGPNSVELKKKYGNYETYTNENLEFDLFQGFHTTNTSIIKSPILDAGDIVTNTMTNRTAIVSPQSAGKVMPQYITKLNFKRNGDAWYLCYLLNESKAVKHQLYKTMEGTVLRRVTVVNLKQLEIKFPQLEKQQKLGELYRLLVIRERLQNQYKNKMKQAIIEIINREDINRGSK